jgi:hypothetical protein
MRKEQFRQELDFGVAIAIAKTLLKQNQITIDEYRKVEAALIQRYHPLIWSLQESTPASSPKKGVYPNMVVVH